MRHSPKGSIWSAVPLTCCFDVVNTRRVAGQQLQEGSKFCRMGKNTVHRYVCTYIHTSIHPPPLAGPQPLLEGPQTPLACPKTPLAGPQMPPACGAR